MAVMMVEMMAGERVVNLVEPMAVPMVEKLGWRMVA